VVVVKKRVLLSLHLHFVALYKFFNIIIIIIIIIIMNKGIV